MENINVNEVLQVLNGTATENENTEQKKESVYTTLRVRKETVERLKHFKQGKEKMWQVIERLCDMYSEQLK